MAKIDASIDDWTPTSYIAWRADIYRTAAQLAAQENTAHGTCFDANDVLEIAHFLVGQDDLFTP